ncbi:hypothetical protein [Leptothermofonsia sp. ETS-13]|uniref:hypothetical protein n=1 Tax=Leptothermofonsia sp. ETS-13 TaxID=3035696 RepID=UPI003B9F924A
MLAVTMLLLSVQGQHVVMSGKRRWVDVHWKRGNSYVRIGWNWLRGCLHKDWALFPSIELQGRRDPAPAIASKKQAQRQPKREFTVQSYQFVACNLSVNQVRNSRFDSYCFSATPLCHFL